MAEHRRDLGVERQGCRESLAGPWMAHQGGPLNPEKRRAAAPGLPRIRVGLFSGSVFFGHAKKMNAVWLQARIYLRGARQRALDFDLDLPSLLRGRASQGFRG